MQTESRFFDDVAKLMSNAAGAAQGVREEVETAFRAQAEKLIEELDLVPRDEFDTVKAMAQKARMENDELIKRIEELEARISEPK